MFPAAEEIAEYFDNEDLHYRVQETESSTRICADVVVDYAAFTVLFISDNEASDVYVRIPHFVRFKKKDLRAVLRVTNQMNEKFRFCKFTVNADIESVTIEYDFPEKTEQIGAAALEIFQRIMQIAEEAYPVYMRAIWGSPEPVNLGKIVFHDIEV